MSTYVILSRVSENALKEPRDFKQLANTVSAKIKTDCPGVVWKNSYVTMGHFDVVDVVEANDFQEVQKAAMIIRSFGHSQTEAMAATP